MGSRLFYHASNIEVQLGDRVKMTRLIRRSTTGTVCYIPGLSEVHDELEYDDVQQWAIRSDDGSVYPILYCPETFQPPKRIAFISRSGENLLEPNEHLE